MNPDLNSELNTDHGEALREMQDSARRVMDGLGLAAPEQPTWNQVVELGWLMVSVPEALSGLGMGSAGACALHTELGRGLATAPYLPAMLALEALCQSALDGREAWLERVMGGELVTAPLADSKIHLDAEVVQGVATGVQSADTATHVLLWTQSRDLVFLVELNQPGIECVERASWDATRRLFDVRLEKVALNSVVRLAEGADADTLIQRLLIQRDVAQAAEAAGGASALLERTVEHLQTRVQFKRPLAMFQALKHRCADMKASIAAAEALLADVQRQLTDRQDLSVQVMRAAGAKMMVTSMFAQVGEESLQLHGGIGMADEHPCHLFLKRALLSQQLGAANDTYSIEIAQDFMAKNR